MRGWRRAAACVEASGSSQGRVRVPAASIVWSASSWTRHSSIAWPVAWPVSPRAAEPCWACWGGSCSRSSRTERRRPGTAGSTSARTRATETGTSAGRSSAPTIATTMDATGSAAVMASRAAPRASGAARTTFRARRRRKRSASRRPPNAARPVSTSAAMPRTAAAAAVSVRRGRPVRVGPAPATGYAVPAAATGRPARAEPAISSVGLTGSSARPAQAAAPARAGCAPARRVRSSVTTPVSIFNPMEITAEHVGQPVPLARPVLAEPAPVALGTNVTRG